MLYAKTGNDGKYTLSDADVIFKEALYLKWLEKIDEFLNYGCTKYASLRRGVIAIE